MQALNDLFDKLLQRDIPSRYLLRLGMGEAELQTQGDYSRAGRVNTMLARRIELLAEVSMEHICTMATSCAHLEKAHLVASATHYHGLMALSITFLHNDLMTRLPALALTRRGFWSRPAGRP